MRQITWKIGGAQGEGIDSCGEILSTALTRLGHHIFAYRHFMSLIRGGHTNYKIRVSPEPVYYHGDILDVLIAFDQRTIDENSEEFHDDTLIVYDNNFEATNPTKKRVELLPVPMSEFANDLGNVIMKNMVAVGVSAAVLQLDPQMFYKMIEDRFARKGADVVQLNKSAVEQGYQYFLERHAKHTRPLPETGAYRPKLLISGNESTGFGALAGGCRFMAAYPITPATEIMYWLVNNLPNFGGKVVQAEDEIAACLMAIGANYTGVRAMTSTSGPGFSLMQESLGLAGIAEIPLVVVDVQRGGPATGLPTKTEQSDLNALLYGSHGEMPRVVLAPSTIEECFYYMIKAFNLAEKYQCPVLIATDLFLGMSKQSLERFDYHQITVNRENIITYDEASFPACEFKRYLDTPSGVSPRSFPGYPYTQYTALSNEHDELGREEQEDPPNRLRQMNKRMRKLNSLSTEDWGARYYGPREPDVLLIGYGSTFGQLHEAREWTAGQGVKIAHLQITAINPFPRHTVDSAISKAGKCLVVENNYTGQLKGVIQREVAHSKHLLSHNRYDGNPLTVGEITDKVKEVL